MRGDILLCEDEDELAAGSPPRARGHPHRGRRPHDDLGLTPACAGTSSGLLPPVGEYRAHPRVRGDIPSTRLLPDVYEGLTPACAGTSVAGDGSRWSWWAHPRVRGDINWTSAEYVPAGGSPPRARGHRRSAGELGQRPGLTPACAGTSRTRLWGWSGREGSPPRARGRSTGPAPPTHPLGLTPACAGTSRRASRHKSRKRAHPRVRGDVDGARAGGVGVRGLTPACAGTSEWIRSTSTVRQCRAHPRVRGDVTGDPGPEVSRGLTPACAGTSTAHSATRWRFGGSPPRARGRLGSRAAGGSRWAHPRVRGDVMVGMFALRRSWAHPRVRGDVGQGVADRSPCRGSPPRARGRPTRREAAVAAGAHPRVRGDVAAGWLAAASSRAHPRVRGDVCLEPGPPGGGPGLTPACAGTSRWKAGRPQMAWGSPPRARGRQAHGDQWLPADAGSPPRARGRPGRRTPWRGDRRGLTPACAGTSTTRTARQTWPGAHPRVRGDVMPAMTAADLPGGSPPRARGRPIESW